MLTGSFVSGAWEKRRDITPIASIGNLYDGKGTYFSHKYKIPKKLGQTFFMLNTFHSKYALSDSKSSAFVLKYMGLIKVQNLLRVYKSYFIM